MNKVLDACDVVVVGSGIAGLTAAYDLQSAGYNVQVLEAASFAGGRMADISSKGLNIHSGATIMWSFYNDMMDLVSELGMSDELIDWERTEAPVDNGEQVYPLRYHFDLPFLAKHPALSSATKLRLAKLLPDIMRSGLNTDPNLIHTAAEYDDMTMAEYLSSKGLDEFLHNYIEPLFRAPWNWKPDKISRSYLMSMMGHLPKAKTLGFRKGIGQLTRRLAEIVPVTCDAKVTSIAPSTSGQGRTVTYRKDGNESAIQCDIVIVATQGNIVENVLPDLSPEDRSFFQSVRYTPVGIVYFLLKDKPEPFTRWYTSNHPSDLVFYSQFDEDPLVPEGVTQRPHLYCELTPETAERIIANGDQNQITKYAEKDARNFFPDFDDQVVDVVEQWIDEMLPEWYVGSAKNVKEFLDRQESKGKRDIYFAGDYISHSHTGGACASGRRTAGTILSNWGRKLDKTG